jgi:hypothetical protein
MKDALPSWNDGSVKLSIINFLKSTIEDDRTYKIKNISISIYLLILIELIKNNLKTPINKIHVE